jgi:hypothetical protein
MKMPNELVEMVTKAICNSRHGGYEAYREKRQRDPHWWQAERDAKAVLNALFGVPAQAALVPVIAQFEACLGDDGLPCEADCRCKKQARAVIAALTPSPQ